MNETFPDVSAKQLLGAGSTLQNAINAATGRAQAVLAAGEFARQKRNEGNMNSSLVSTADGALHVAGKIASRFTLDEQPQKTETCEHAFFGDNIRRTIAAFRVLGRK